MSCWGGRLPEDCRHSLTNSMADPERPERGFRFTDPRQDRIYRRLLLIGPGPAVFFKDACALMTGGLGIQTTSHLVAHLLRDVESGLRRVLLPYDFKGQAAGSDADSQGGSHKKQVNAILAAYGIDALDEAAKAWLRLTDEDTGLARLAHRRGLGPPRAVDDEIRRTWEEVQNLLAAILAKFETRFLEPFALLDELLAKPAPSAADAKRLRNNIPQNPVTLGYFFDKLENPAWLPLLRKEEFFAHPPEPERNDEDGTIALPPWPGSRYLARMAAVASAQATVLEIALQIPQTENVRVYEDLADAARALSAQLAARLAGKLEDSLTLPYQILLPEKIGALVAHLAAAGEREVALRLADRLLELRRRERTRPGGEGEADDTLLPEAEGTFNTWRYRQIVQKHIPALVSAAGLDVLQLLARRLDEALALSRRQGGEGKPDDYSAIWRPRIEDRGERDRGVKDVLVSAIRDAAEQIVREDASRLEEVIRILEERQWHVFERIALHVLLVHRDGGDALIRARLTGRRLFDESERRQLRREYRRLARDHFGRLTAEDQALILGWIETGPDVGDFRANFERWEGRSPTEEEVARHVRQWQLDHLAPIAQALPGRWRSRYEALAAEFGTPPAADFAVETSAGFHGPTSPLSTEELKVTPVEEIVEYLRGWTPPVGFMAPSREGVGRALAEAVAAHPGRFLPALRAFRGLHPTYVRSLIEGLVKALAEQRPFEWSPVIGLCGWVVEQPREFPGGPSDRARHHDEDPDWGWTRKTIARLTMAGLESKTAPIPVTLRYEVWADLRALTDDPDPTPEHEARYGGTNMDPPTLAINSVRGDAMHAVVDYALWVRRSFPEGPEGEARAAKGFEEMPEVREVLERHLDPAAEPSAAIRSAYGRHLPWLIMLDRAWVVANLGRIFPEDPALARLLDAAWETYIVFCPPYNDALVVLRDEYAKAVDRIGTKPERVSGPGNPDEHLGDQLMVFYWRGKLTLEEPDGLLTRFYAKAGPELRRDAIEFFGRSLREVEGEVESEVRERLVRLWERRAEAARASGDTKELETFGWWFASGKLDETLAVRELLNTLRVTKRIDPDFLVLERLRDLAPRVPQEAVECLRHMVDGARESWELHAWREEMERSLRAVLRTNDEAAKKAAADLINVLASKGHVSFRNLLN